MRESKVYVARQLMRQIQTCSWQILRHCAVPQPAEQPQNKHNHQSLKRYHHAHAMSDLHTILEVWNTARLQSSLIRPYNTPLASATAL